MRIPESRAHATSAVAVWETGDWQVSATLESPDGEASLSRAEFQRFLDGLDRS